MAYLVAQIWLFLLLAGLIGSVIGWVLRGSCKHQIKDLEESWNKQREKLSEAEERLERKGEEFLQLSKERNQLTLEVKRLQKKQQGTDALTSELSRLKAGVKNVSAIHQKTSKSLEQNLKLLAFAKQSAQAKENIIVQLKDEVVNKDSLLVKSQSQLAACQAELKDKSAGLENHMESSDRLHTLQVKQVEDEKKLSAYRSEKEQLAMELQTKEQELAARASEGEKVGNLLKEKEKELAAITSESEKVGNLLKNKEKELAALNDQLSLFKQQGEKYIISVTQDNEKKQVVIDKLQAEVEQLKSSLQEGEQVANLLKNKEQELQMTNEQFSSFKKQSMDCITSINEDGEQKQAAIDALQVELEQLKNSLQEKDSVISELRISPAVNPVTASAERKIGRSEDVQKTSNWGASAVQKENDAPGNSPPRLNFLKRSSGYNHLFPKEASADSRNRSKDDLAASSWKQIKRFRNRKKRR